MEWMENEKKRWDEKAKGINFTDEAEVRQIPTFKWISWYYVVLSDIVTWYVCVVQNVDLCTIIEFVVAN